MTKSIIKSILLLLVGMNFCTVSAQQSINIKHPAQGRLFEGIGAVNGGGATAVLLKDYPEPQRSQIMDMVFRPKFGASVSTMLAEIPGDGNSTQGSMPSHSHYKGDQNYSRGYTWWVLREAKKRNAALTLDATAWSAPRWVGKFWTQDMADYYVDWLQGLRSVYGLELDAIGCHNEAGYDYNFAKALRRTMNERGFSNVRLHAFDNWGKNKLDFLSEMAKDSALRDAIDIVSCHTFTEIPITEEQRKLAENMGKTIWNSEEHIYRKGFDCLISIVKAFNENYITSGATKVVNWYDIAGVYPLEPYSHDPAMLLAREPWSGHYEVREALWGYAHYGQFCEVGWKYVDEGCCKLDKGGTMITLRDDKTQDYTIIIETKGADSPQDIRVVLPKQFKAKKMCMWLSNEQDQFVRQDDAQVRSHSLKLTLQPNSVYTISTTTGQQKGAFTQIPESSPFPIPYAEDFNAYQQPAQWGYLPHYMADIIGCFELVDNPCQTAGKHDLCLQQVVSEHTLSWAPEWHHYTIFGDDSWSDYEVAADVYLNPRDEAGIMGRICNVGTGYGVWAKGYYMTVNDKGECKLVLTSGKLNKKELIGDAEQQAAILARKDEEIGGEFVLDKALAPDFSALEWHRLQLRFEGNDIVGLVDGKPVVKATSDRYKRGMAGFIAPLQANRVPTPYFDNLSVTPLGNTSKAGKPLPTVQPLY